jgi:hypothetical protein
MNKEPYEFESVVLEGADVAYRFVSVGKKGNLTKLVAFQNIQANLYNLALLDYDEATKTIDDESISDNGDMSRVLSTTWKIMFHFLQSFPEKEVAIHGNTDTKQKLYKRLISSNLLSLKQQYNVSGVSYTGIAEPFDASKEYLLIIIQSLPI